MEKIDYDKLNSYLNEIFLILNDYDRFLIDNILRIARLNNEYITTIGRYRFLNNTIQNKLTFEDVYLLARKIIESINPTYLSDYDELIKTGKLDFRYENECDESEFVHKNNLINIRREFNYNDVVTLVHEFIHYTNGKNEKSQNRYLLTEFLSIYFETYAIDYLMEQGVPENEIDIFYRLRTTIKTSISLSKYEIIFLAYEKFGNINEETFKYLNKYFLSIEQQVFEIECRDLLEYINQKEEEYKSKLNNEKEFIFEFCSPFFYDYKYFLGTILAYYARKNCELDDIVYLNDHINDDDLGNLKISDLLKKIGMDINGSVFTTNTLESINGYIEKYSNEKSR